MSTCCEAERKRREVAEKQRDCAHRQTEWGICTDCHFDYRTYDADDSKCPKCGSWRDHALLCPRCEPPRPAATPTKETGLVAPKSFGLVACEACGIGHYPGLDNTMCPVTVAEQKRRGFVPSGEEDK